MNPNQLTLIDYINTPEIESFQAIAGSRLGNLGKSQQWAILAVLSRAAEMARSSESDSISTFKALSTFHVMPSDKTMKCLDTLNGFPTDRVGQLTKAIEDIRPLKSFPAWTD